METELKKIIQNFMESDVTLLTSSYVGRGRPKKSDYRTIKRKDLPDFYAFEIFKNGFRTNVSE